jgi:ATP-dependent helicase/nuclease subunit B
MPLNGKANRINYHYWKDSPAINTVKKLPIIEVPVGQNILQYTADYIIETFADDAPDFSKFFVLLPHAQVTPSFNKTLCESTNDELPAIIPPWSGTLKAWANKFSHNEHDDYSLINSHARQLLFIEALQQYPNLFKEENQWQVTQALLSLFDELSLNQINIFSSPEEWNEQLQQAYGLNDQHQHLLNESKLVHTLWFAWQQQLSENRLYDETSDYLSRLTNARTVSKPWHFICLGLSQYTRAEKDFIQYLVNNEQCHIIEYGAVLDDNHADDTNHVFASFVNETFQHTLEAREQRSIKQRAQDFRNNHPELKSTDIPFSVYLASNEETQIRAIDYQVRLHTLNGKSNIAIISEDRKLSRRLRALLERANIPLQDDAGWSLATTQAATIIERWLECIEENFSAYPLLDCLKSPFINITQHMSDEEADQEKFTKNIYRLEHDVIFHENVSSDIDEYKSALKSRLKRLSQWPANSYDELINTLNHIQQTAKPLLANYSNEKKILLSDFLTDLINSLDSLGVLKSYQKDEAGLILLKTLTDLQQSTNYSNPSLSWYDCRIWLGMALESQNFTPPTSNTNVRLMTLEQASYQNFDCVIIAAAEAQHFPGSPNNSPFFNQSVRESLQLPTWKEQRKNRHELFNRTLLSASEILLTACNEEKGEEKPVSPWLELLINFHQLVFQKGPDNEELHQLVLSNTEVSTCDDCRLPEPSIQSSPSLPISLIPDRISASAYQRIINCPYQYFSADGLKLKPLEELSDELKKSGYGQLIHLILQTFHSGDKNHGKAFDQIITVKNRLEAETYLDSISIKVFLKDVENNVLHRSWLYRWQKHIPSYINWQIQHQLDWNTYLNEQHFAVSLNDSIEIYGRIDRIDIHNKNETHAIIDYKTGQTARQEDIENGENVQLSSYALLDEQASEVSYLSVDSSYQKVETKSSLSGEDLQTNLKENSNRLILLFKQMNMGEPLNAWGDDTVCRYCNFSGLCRKAEWDEA